MRGRDEICTRTFGRENLKKGQNFADLGVDGRVNIRIDHTENRV
jgi:hypothetical protein